MGQENISVEDNVSTDWHQVKETILMLDTVVTQLGWTLRDGDNSVDTLASSFTQMLDGTSAILKSATQLEEGVVRDEILENGQLIFAQMQSAIVAFQFYDKLSQRLNHASGSLEHLADLIGNPERRQSPDEWQKMQNEIRERYTTEADRVMFDAVLKGASLEEAIEIFREYEAQQEDDELELF
ncbi:MAG: hypothetical protein OQK78_02930 [Gammaproteobacteria bacterium]|nr:hypothetical protein [Gammaproteobacteria bacterium]